MKKTRRWCVRPGLSGGSGGSWHISGRQRGRGKPSGNEAEELVESINLPDIMTSESMGGIDQVIVLLDTKFNENVSWQK